MGGDDYGEKRNGQNLSPIIKKVELQLKWSKSKKNNNNQSYQPEKDNDA